jgi:hypothetical protein
LAKAFFNTVIIRPAKAGDNAKKDPDFIDIYLTDGLPGLPTTFLNLCGQQCSNADLILQ